MAMIRWSPFSDLLRVQDEMNRLFDDARRRGPDERSLDATWVPAVDIYEDPESYVIKAELPEMAKKDVNISLENNTLTLSGERKLERDESKDQYHTIERVYGRFSRSFTLPDAVDREKVGAEMKDGVLRVTLPKRAETKPRAIDIKVK